VAAAERVLVVLDDDPTGTQSVSDIPVLTRWEEEDFCWAFRHLVGTRPAPAVYVLTNTRSLEAVEAAARNRDVVTNALAAAVQTGSTLGFVSRSDSTLRGHYPLEPDVIAATLKEVAGQTTDGVVIVPAFPDAGRISIGGVHYMRNGGTVTPVAERSSPRTPASASVTRSPSTSASAPRCTWGIRRAFHGWNASARSSMFARP
jgi:uncharacterized protein YgbK (DUF1537 family)